MLIEVGFLDMKTYLRVSCHGVWDPASVSETMLRIKAETRQTGHARVLLDWRGIEPPAREFYRYLAGEDIAAWVPSLRMAALYHSALINKFAENVAVNRGASFRVFGREEEALRWLLQGLPGKAEADDV